MPPSVARAARFPCPAARVCGRCLAEPPGYDATRAALAYDFPADALVHALKFRSELALAPLLAELLLPEVQGEGIDRVIPVPLSGARLRSRGYNQAAEIARPLARGKLDLDTCVREGDARPQMELPWDERRRNIRGAFRCRRSVIGATHRRRRRRDDHGRHPRRARAHIEARRRLRASSTGWLRARLPPS